MAAALLVFYQGFTQDFYQGEVWQLLTNTGPVARLVLLLLLGFSILSWAIIFRKFRTFRAAQRRIAGIPQGLPAEQEALGDSRLLPHAEGEPAAGGFPIRLSRN